MLHTAVWYSCVWACYGDWSRALPAPQKKFILPSVQLEGAVHQQTLKTHLKWCARVVFSPKESTLVAVNERRETSFTQVLVLPTLMQRQSTWRRAQTLRFQVLCSYTSFYFRRSDLSPGTNLDWIACLFCRAWELLVVLSSDMLRCTGWTPCPCRAEHASRNLPHTCTEAL